MFLKLRIKKLNLDLWKIKNFIEKKIYKFYKFLFPYLNVKNITIQA